MIDYVIRIELTRAILMPRFSNFLKNSIIEFRMFLFFVICFLRVTVSLICQLQATSKIHVPIYPYLISEGRRNCSTSCPCRQRNRDQWNKFMMLFIKCIIINWAIILYYLYISLAAIVMLIWFQYILCKMIWID